MTITFSNLYPFFDEGDYLAFNQDVRVAVNQGSFESGFDHYLRFGQFENRVAAFSGTAGNDVIRGFGNFRYLFPTAYEIISTDPYDSRVIGTGTGEIDILIGGPGADHFGLAAYITPSTPNAVQLYLGEGDNDYALIQNFGFATDSIELAGSPADYSQEVINGSLHIYNRNPRDLVAIVEGVTAPMTVVERPLFGSTTEDGTFFLGSVNNFDEVDYLAFNPDVREALAIGAFTSAYEHYVQFGQFEGRAATFVGTVGNDVISSFGNGPRYIYPTAYELVSADPFDYRLVGTGTGEVDILIGAPGPDNFALAAFTVPSAPATPFYVGQGDNDYALIRNFERGVDSIEVFGSIENYRQEVVQGNLNLYLSSAGDDLVAILEGVTAPLSQIQPAFFEANEGTIFLG